MKYKVEKGSPLFDVLEALKIKMIVANAATADYAENIGATQWARGTHIIKDHIVTDTIAAGGFSAGIFDDDEHPPPAGWVRVHRKHYGNAFAPHLKKNKEDWEIINALPVVTLQEMNSAIRFNGDQFVGNMWIKSYQILFGVKNHIIAINPAAKYKPITGMIEIVESEYIALKTKINATPEVAATR